MSDSHLRLKCPACDRLMQKIFFPKEGVNVDLCVDGCGGMYFDNRELGFFAKQSVNLDDILETVNNKDFAEVDSTSYRGCAVCGARMIKNFTSVSKHVKIDECYSCGGKFLDNCELQKMRAEYNSEKDKIADISALMHSAVGNELQLLEKEQSRLLKCKTIFTKIFHKMVFD